MAPDGVSAGAAQLREQHIKTVPTPRASDKVPSRSHHWGPLKSAAAVTLVHCAMPPNISRNQSIVHTHLKFFRVPPCLLRALVGCVPLRFARAQQCVQARHGRWDVVAVVFKASNWAARLPRAVQHETRTDCASQEHGNL